MDPRLIRPKGRANRIRFCETKGDAEFGQKAAGPHLLSFAAAVRGLLAVDQNELPARAAAKGEESKGLATACDRVLDTRGYWPGRFRKWLPCLS